MFGWYFVSSTFVQEHPFIHLNAPPIRRVGSLKLETIIVTRGKKVPTEFRAHERCNSVVMCLNEQKWFTFIAAMGMRYRDIYFSGIFVREIRALQMTESD